MILVTGQSGFSGEGFLAVGVRAFVRSLARMYSSMSRKRARVAERLGTGQNLGYGS